MRVSLWPEATREEHLRDMEAMLKSPERYRQFMCCDEKNTPLGFAEASIRADYVNGTTSSPVAFLEGIYVVPAYRRRGVARHLADAVGDWAFTRGCREFASDALLDNTLSHAFHKALGFEETERVVYFRKRLGA